MSAWGEHRAGMISDMEYSTACREEEETSRYWEEHPEEFEGGEEFEDDEIDEF